jgi:hypothetical protein
MDSLLRPPQTLSFDRFWTWLQDHPNCILRCGSLEATLFDHADFHWVFFEEEDRRVVVQVLLGKTLVGELVIPGRDVTEVKVAPDPDGASEGHHLVELIGGPKEDPQPLFHFLLSHDVETAPGHQGGYKH